MRCTYARARCSAEKPARPDRPTKIKTGRGESTGTLKRHLHAFGSPGKTAFRRLATFVSSRITTEILSETRANESGRDEPWARRAFRAFLSAEMRSRCPAVVLCVLHKKSSSHRIITGEPAEAATNRRAYEQRRVPRVKYIPREMYYST